MSDDIVDFNQWGSHVPRMPRIPRMPGPLLRVAAGLVAAIVLLTTTFYQVPPEAVGVVLRFGRYVRTAEPGLHLKAPFAEEVIKVPVQRQLKQEFGFRTGRSRHPHRVRQGQLQRRIDDAHGRSQRRDRRMDRPVPACRIRTSSSSKCVTPKARSAR